MFTKNFLFMAGYTVFGLYVERFVGSLYSGCMVPTYYTMELYFYALVGYLCVYQLGVNRICETMCAPIFLGLFCLVQLFLILSTVFLMLNVFFSHSCAPAVVWVADSILVLAGIIVMQPLVFLALKIYLWIVCVAAHLEAAWSKVEFVFDRFVDPIIGKQNFHAALNSFTLSQTETNLLVAQFGRMQQGNQDRVPPEHRQCCHQCRQPFMAGMSLVDHPGCGDTFHTGCLLRHLTSVAASCPQCGCGTRQSMGVHVHRRMQNEIERRIIGHEFV